MANGKSGANEKPKNGNQNRNKVASSKEGRTYRQITQRILQLLHERSQLTKSKRSTEVVDRVIQRLETSRMNGVARRNFALSRDGKEMSEAMIELRREKNARAYFGTGRLALKGDFVDREIRWLEGERRRAASPKER